MLFRQDEGEENPTQLRSELRESLIHIGEKRTKASNNGNSKQKTKLWITAYVWCTQRGPTPLAECLGMN